MSEEHQAKREGCVDLIRIEKDAVAVDDNLSKVLIRLERVQSVITCGQ